MAARAVSIEARTLRKRELEFFLYLRSFHRLLSPDQHCVCRLGHERGTGHNEPGVWAPRGSFFFGFFIFEIPSNLLLHRVGARVWIARLLN